MPSTQPPTRLGGEPHGPPGDADPDGRFVTDSRGAEWYIVEVDAAGVAGALAPRCLVAHTVGAVRRAWTYPRDWRALPEGALAEIFGRPH